MAASSSMEFQPGDEVEVAVLGEGFENSYFEATVVSKVEGSSKYTVQYKTLLREDESGPLEEFAEADQLRPRPPKVPVSCFSLYELADVWENEGWWAGIIYGKFQSDYFLYHPATEEEKPYSLEQLRVHHEWRNGQWICHKAVKNTHKHTHNFFFSY